MELDHVLIAVDDLVTSAAGVEARHGLSVTEGGRHAGWGTANRIVPLGDAYVELLAVVDAQEAAGSGIGRWVAAARDGTPLGWAVRTDDLDAVAARLGLVVRAGSRPAPGGGVLTWRLAGVEQAVVEPCLPFFIEWAPDADHPGHTGAPPSTRIAKVVLGGDAARISAWIGPHSLPLEIRDGDAAVIAVVIDSAGEEIILGSTGG